MSRPIVVVANVVYDKQGRFLVGLHRDGHKENLYAFPGGKVEDESCTKAFWRELREETGLKKNFLPLEFLGISEQSFKEKRFLILFYATLYDCAIMGLPYTVEPHKHYKWEWLTIDEIRQKPLAGSTKDFVEKLYPKWQGY